MLISSRFLPLASLIVYMIGFSIGFGCIPFLLLGEIFPVEHRSILSSIAGSFNLGVMFIVIKTYHYLEKVNGDMPHTCHVSRVFVFEIIRFQIVFNWVIAVNNDCRHILDVFGVLCICCCFRRNGRARDKRSRFG